MERHILFAVIPAEAGIQWHLRGAHLDPGSALRAVGDDVSARPRGPSGMTSPKKKRAVGDDVSSRKDTAAPGGCFVFDVIPGPPQAEPGIQ